MLREIVREAARRFDDLAAFVAADGTVLTYAELDRRSDRVAAGLTEDGVADGDVVALVLPSDFDYVICYAGATKVGAVTAGVNPRLTEAEREAVLDIARPRLVVTPTVAHRLQDAAGPVPAIEPDPERLVAIVFTSGTTGTPRGAMFGERELLAIARSDVPDWDDPERWGGGGHQLASTQFAHIGFMTKLPWYLRLGTTTHLLDRWRASDVLDLIEQHRMSTVGGVAPQLALLLREPDLDERDLSCVKAIIMGGAHSPPALVDEARRRLAAAYSIRYSSTESGGVGTGTAFDADDEEALHTIGRPRASVEVEVRDEADRPVPPGEVGELCLRSPCMMRGYWNDSEASEVTLRGGWLHTGDLALVDGAGRVRLAGRKKEMFVRGGYNVYPLEVEAVLTSHPGVDEVVVVPRPDEVLGEIGVAVVVPADPSAPPSVDDLRAFARHRLAAYKLPEAVRVVEALPLTSMQKVDRRRLAAHEAGTG